MKPTTEHIITALRDGVALRTELCARLGCDNAALTKVIRNLLDRDLISRDMEDGALAYYLTPKGRAWQPGMQSASVRAAAKRAKGDSEGGEADVASAPAPKTLEDYTAQYQRVVEGHAAQQAGPDVLRGVIKVLEDDVRNAQALADKLQHLLTSKEHECESLRAQMAHACNGECKPDMETVPLAELIQHIALFLDDGVSLTIYGSDTASVQAFGKSFVCSYAEANGVLDSAAMLARLEAA